MKIDIWVSFNYGGWMLSFSKTIELPFVPFYGLQLIENDDEHENIIKIETTEFQEALIYYYVGSDQIEINVRERWKRPVSDETIDETIEIYNHFKWIRHDTTNVDELKALMKREHERINKPL